MAQYSGVYVGAKASLRAQSAPPAAKPHIALFPAAARTWDGLARAARLGHRLTDAVDRGVVQAKVVSHGGYLMDLKGSELEAFERDRNAYVEHLIERFEQRILDICQEFTEEFGEDRLSQIDQFYEAAQELKRFPERSIAEQNLEMRRRAFIDHWRFRAPIEDLALGLGGTTVAQAMTCFRRVSAESGQPPSMIKVTGSSGGTVTFIPSGRPWVVQFYVASATYWKVLSLSLGSGQQGPSSNVAPIISFWPANQAMVVAKVRPVASSADNPQEKEQSRRWVLENANTIFNHIAKGVIDLHRAGVSQGDVRLDNVGEAGGRAVLFDFNQLRKANKGTLLEDLETLRTSINYWAGKTCDLSLNPTLATYVKFHT